MASDGPLAGVRVLELGGLGPATFCGMLLADHGADVLRLAAPGPRPEPLDQPLLRNRRVLELDLRSAAGTDRALALVDRADVVIEGFRPGVAERLGLGPEPCLARRPALVYGRMTGWGQTGPLAATAGHDITYVALTGVLGAIGRPGAAPTVPLNLVGDFGGGGMLLAFGVLAALQHAQRTGAGQVIDAAMVDGASLLATMISVWSQEGRWAPERGTNLLDGGAPFYDIFATSDGRYMAVGALEPQFFAVLVAELGLEDQDGVDHLDRAGWPALREAIAAAFARGTQREWTERFAALDGCVAPVLDFAEAREHPHNVARDAYIMVDGVAHPAPAPRFGGTPSAAPVGPVAADGGYLEAVWDVAGEPA